MRSGRTPNHTFPGFVIDLDPQNKLLDDDVRLSDPKTRRAAIVQLAMLVSAFYTPSAVSCPFGLPMLALHGLRPVLRAWLLRWGRVE